MIYHTCAFHIAQAFWSTITFCESLNLSQQLESKCFQDNPKWAFMDLAISAPGG